MPTRFSDFVYHSQSPWAQNSGSNAYTVQASKERPRKWERVLPVGRLDRYDLLCSLSAEELIAQTHGIVATADDTLRAMLASDQRDTIGPSEFS